ncbi:hypothetical protein V8C86DRAFT_3035916 [Haematococcus lacustris]
MARAIDVALVAFFYENGAAATMTATTLAPNLKSLLTLLAYHQVKQNFKLSQELKSLIHCGYQCGVTFEVASVLPIPSNVVAGAVEGGAHLTGGDLDAPSLPTAPAQASPPPSPAILS